MPEVDRIALRAAGHDRRRIRAGHRLPCREHRRRRRAVVDTARDHERRPIEPLHVAPRILDRPTAERGASSNGIDEGVEHAP